MYEAFFNLSNDPFRLLPDPGICFPHRSCAKAWAYLRYALKRGEGIVVVTGPPGSGKTTLAERLLNELNPAKTVSVRLIANDLNATDLLRKLAYSLGLPAEGMDRAMLAHRIERYLIELEHSNRRALVVIDEAQTLSHHSLEAMRLLTDMQSRSRPVLQLILLGQEELEGVMSAPGMEQFQHRVIASCRLHTMDLMETKAYLEYRLGYADWHGDPSFNGPAVMAIFQESRGLPRHVNKICSRLLLHASSEERHALNERDVHAVMRDLREEWIAPLDGDALRSQRVPSGALDSVYELALVPGTRPAPSPRKATVREGAPDLAVGEERSTASGGVKNTAAPAPGGYLYGMSRRRSPALLRRVRGLLRGAFDQFARLVERSVDWTSGFGGYLARGYAQSQRWWRRASSWLRAWLDGAGFPALLERARPLLDGDRRMLGAGVGAVVAAALVITVLVVSWDAGQQQRPAPASVAASEGEAIDGHLGQDAFPAGQSVLGDAGAYLEAAAAGASPGDPLGQGSPTATAARLPTSGTPDGPDPAATVGLYRSKQSANAADLDSVAGVAGAVEQPLLGQSADAAAGLLIDQAALHATRLGVRTPTSAAEIDPTGEAVRASSGPATGATLQPANPQGVAAHLPGRDEPAAVAGTVDDGGQLGFSISEQDNPFLDFARVLPATSMGMSVRPAGESAQPSTPLAATDISTEPVPGWAGPLLDAAADDALIAAPEAASEPAGKDAATGGEVADAPTDEVARLIARAKLAMSKNRLTLPEQGSAYSYYQRALKLDADNERVQAGIDEIVSRYGELAGTALAEKDFDKARQYVGRALRIDPDDPATLVMRDRVDEAVAQAESEALAAAELARMAAEAPPPPPAAPKPNNRNSLQRLMQFVDGHVFGSNQ